MNQHEEKDRIEGMNEKVKQGLKDVRSNIDAQTSKVKKDLQEKEQKVYGDVFSTREELHSDSLVDIGQDSVLDSVISASTLVAAILYIMSGISLESWLGAVISLVIIKSGLSMMGETFSRILGERADASLSREIKATILELDDVCDVYDLVLNNYGPDTFNGSVHVTVPDTLSAAQIDELKGDGVYKQ